MVRRRPGLNAAFRSLSFSNAQVWQNNLGWERRAATLWGYKLEFNLCSLAKLKPSSAVIIPLTCVFHSLPLCHPAEWEEIHLTLKNTRKNLKIRFPAATKVLDFYQHLDHACRGRKRFLEMADEENDIQGVRIIWQKPRVTLDEKEATNLPICHSGLQSVPVRPFCSLGHQQNSCDVSSAWKILKGIPGKAVSKGWTGRASPLSCSQALCHTDQCGEVLPI